MQISEIAKVATRHRCMSIGHNQSSKMLSYLKNGVRINVYYSKMTVGICCDGVQFFRKNVSEIELSRIFYNPHRYEARKVKNAYMAVDLAATDGDHSVYSTTDKNNICANRFVRFINSFFITKHESKK